MKYTGTIRFLPSLTSLESFAADDASNGAAGKKKVPPPSGQPPDKAKKKEPPVEFSVKGYDLDHTLQCDAHGKTKPAPPPQSKSETSSSEELTLHNDESFCVYVPGPDFEWQALSPTIASVKIPAALANATTVRFQLFPQDAADDSARHVVWDLATPKSAKKSNTVTVVVMHKGDSGLVSFEGASYAAKPTVTFESAPPMDVVYDPNNKSKLGVYVQTSVTKTTGQKELKAVVPGVDKPIMLPIEVVN